MTTQIRRIRLYASVAAVVWTASLVCSLAWLWRQERNNVLAIARAEARATYEKDILYRRWATGHGGVYVPATDRTPPNPHLSHIPERDIATPSGTALTLVNPAYMTRQVFEFASQQQQVVRGHITSLKPIRPENAPDPWEVGALRAFEQGAQEVSGVQVMDGHRYLRLMRPFVTEKGCLKCHASQGYKIGDIRGGVSASVPLEAHARYADRTIRGGAATHGIIWLLGMGMIGMGTRSLVRSDHALQESEERYRTVADHTADWEYWQAQDGGFRYVSPSCASVCGYTHDEFYRNPGLMESIIHPDDLHAYTAHVHAARANGSQESIDFRIVTCDGRVRWISHVCRAVFGRNGKENGRRASNRDITGRKLAEEALHDQAIELEEEIAERQQVQEALQEQATLLEEEIAERQAAQEALAVKQLQLEKLNVSLQERIDAAIADLRQRDRMLIQQSRLAAMGEMISNIAHQWRQPLNNVGLIVQNLRLDFEAGTLTVGTMAREVKNAMDGILFMSHTIDDFRNFFRPDKEKSAFSITRSIDTTLEFIGASLASHGIGVDFAAAEDITVQGYANEFTQVVLNIINNAKDVLVTRNVRSPCITIRVSRENGRAVVTIRDNGGGIDARIVPKIFDPYFTTKEKMQGTGIGLYMSKSIIEGSMGGRLTVANVEDGAEFRIEL
ncbi:MAG TPA: DUF3365 domain-containing protein [Desulfuromonadaceae bacterium]